MIPFSLHQWSNSEDVNSGPLSVRTIVGVPRLLITFSKVRVIRLAESEVSTSIAKASREQSSITLNVRNFLLPTMLSLIKSILQLALMRLCCFKGCFTLAGNRRLPFLRLFSFNNLYTRYTFLWL